MDIAIFTFNDFSENCYILYDDSKQCVIIDPGCNNDEERKTLTDVIDSSGLTPVLLLNTHCHIDHVLGNKFVADTYELPLTSHRGEAPVLAMQPQVSSMYGIPYDPSPEITKYLEDGDKVSFGNTTLEVLYTPGHSPASISFYCREAGIVIGGDVLFQGSIGRTDLPGGDFDTLADSIRTKFYTLPDETVVFCGHGPSTTVGSEKKTNPFVTAK